MRFLCALLLTIPLAAADLAVAPQSLTFYYQLNSPILVAQAIAIASPQPQVVTLSRPIADTWLWLSADNQPSVSTTAPGLLQVAVNPGKLTPGTYNSAVTLRFPDSTVTVPVKFQISAGTVMAASPTVLFFDPTAGPQSLIAALSNGQTLPIAPSTTTPWLAVTAASNPWLVTANGARAPAVVTVGTVQLRSSPLVPVANNPFDLPVVWLPNSLTSRGPLAIAPSSLSFNGSGSQQVSVTGAAFTATPDSAWLTATPSAGGLTLSANPAGLANGSYQATITLASGGVLQPIAVTLTVGAAAQPSISKIVNAASYASPGISPGEVVVLGGTAIGPATLAGLTLDPSGEVSTAIAGVQVLFNGVPAPMVYATATQTAAVAPYELDGASIADIVVTVSGQRSNTLTVPVVPAVPGIFTVDASGAGPGAILNADFSFNGPAHPAAKGETVAIYMTGEGQTTPGGTTGKVTATPPVPRQNVTATVDGQPAAVQFAGEAPGLVSGVMQVNVTIPAGPRSGQLPLVVTVGGVPSQNGVTVSVR
jgi:trimeric autotransporter adhesin